MYIATNYVCSVKTLLFTHKVYLIKKYRTKPKTRIPGCPSNKTTNHNQTSLDRREHVNFE